MAGAASYSLSEARELDQLRVENAELREQLGMLADGEHRVQIIKIAFSFSLKFWQIKMCFS